MIEIGFTRPVGSRNDSYLAQRQTKIAQRAITSRMEARERHSVSQGIIRTGKGVIYGYDVQAVIRASQSLRFRLTSPPATLVIPVSRKAKENSHEDIGGRRSS